MEISILKKITESLQNGKSAALVTLTESAGSTPRKKGSMMAVWGDGSSYGSVGGGAVEHHVIQKAVDCIHKQEDASFDYTLNEEGDLGMICGGSTRGFIKVFGVQEKLLIVGGGHIGVELFKLAKCVSLSTVVFDDREEYANFERFPHADDIRCGDIGQNLAAYDINDKTYIVIATRGHAQDQAALGAVVGRNAAYIGVIGSTKKTKQMMNSLVTVGVAREALQRVYAPIGLDIASEQPAEIALAILSEVMLVKNKGSLNHLSTLKGEHTEGI